MVSKSLVRSYTRLPLAVRPLTGCILLYGLNGCVSVTILDKGPRCLYAESFLGVFNGLKGIFENLSY